MLKKISKLQAIRIIIQICIFILLPGLFALTFDGIKQTYLMILNGKFDLIQLIPHLVEALVVIPITIIFGRFFCGWLCAFGALADFIYIISYRVFKIRFRINEKVHSIIKYLKYVVLLFIVIVIWTKGSNLFDSFSPWKAFAQMGELPKAIFQYTAGFGILALILSGSMFIERFFCRYLCPLGAIFTLISRYSFFKIEKPTANCGSCRLCTNKCSMGISLYKTSKVDSGECINCLKCIGTCPKKNPQITVFDEKVTPALTSAVVITAFAGLYSISNIIGNTANANSSTVYIDDTSNIPVSQQTNIPDATSNQAAANPIPSPQRVYKDGTFIGIGSGHRPGLQVAVTIKDDKITNIEILSNYETPRFSKAPFNLIPEKIIQAQSVKVDVVSGATETSDGIIMAVKDALDQAKA